MREPWRSVGAGLLCGVALAPVGVAAQLAVEDPGGSAERHQVREGETLSQVAEQHLGSAEAWPRLWSYNPEITNPHYIYPGHVLRLKEGVVLAPDGGGAGAGGALAPGASQGSLAMASRSTPRLASGVVRVGEEVYLDRQALATAGRIVASNEDHLMFSPTDMVYLEYEKDVPVPAVGRELTVFLREHRAEVSARAGKRRRYASRDRGEIVRVVGALRVADYDPERRIARAVLIEALDPIERGFEVADVPRRLPEVPPKTNARDAQGKIVAAVHPLGTLGDGQLVFIDAGSNEGVDVGNRFWVVRQGDPWRKQLSQSEELTGARRPLRNPPPDSRLPPETIAELRVLYVRPETSTALITSATTEVSPGDRVEMRKGY